MMTTKDAGERKPRATGGLVANGGRPRKAPAAKAAKVVPADPAAMEQARATAAKKQGRPAPAKQVTPNFKASKSPKAPTADAKADAKSPKSDAKSPESDAAIDDSTPAGKLARTEAAKAEAKLLKEWEAKREGERPSTPNLDALRVQYEAGGARKAKAKRTGGGGVVRGISDADMEAWLRKAFKANPTLTRTGAIKAYRAEGISCRDTRFRPVWDKVTAGRKAAAA